MKKLRILVVDDDKNIRQCTKELLEFIGHEVWCEAGHGRHGLDEFVRNQPFLDLIVTDYQMPHANGVEMIKGVRFLSPHIPIILISGSPESFGEAREAGVTKILPKPFTLTELREALARAFPEPVPA